MEDDVKINDALISTDVDRIIKIISEKKKMSIGKLQSTCKMNRRTLEKWINVLEDEGYISIVYGLTGTYIVWNGDSVMKTGEESNVNDAYENLKDNNTTVPQDIIDAEYQGMYGNQKYKQTAEEGNEDNKEYDEYYESLENNNSYLTEENDDTDGVRELNLEDGKDNEEEADGDNNEEVNIKISDSNEDPEKRLLEYLEKKERNEFNKTEKDENEKSEYDGEKIELDNLELEFGNSEDDDEYEVLISESLEDEKELEEKDGVDSKYENKSNVNDEYKDKDEDYSLNITKKEADRPPESTLKPTTTAEDVKELIGSYVEELKKEKHKMEELKKQ